MKKILLTIALLSIVPTFNMRSDYITFLIEDERQKFGGSESLSDNDLFQKNIDDIKELLREQLNKNPSSRLENYMPIELFYNNKPLTKGKLDRYLTAKERGEQSVLLKAVINPNKLKEVAIFGCGKDTYKITYGPNDTIGEITKKLQEKAGLGEKYGIQLFKTPISEKENAAAVIGDSPALYALDYLDYRKIR